MSAEPGRIFVGVPENSSGQQLLGRSHLNKAPSTAHKIYTCFVAIAKLILVRLTS